MSSDNNNQQQQQQQQPKLDQDSTNKSQLNDSVLSNDSLRSQPLLGGVLTVSNNSPSNANNANSLSQEEKCDRCNRAIRKFEDAIRCTSGAGKCDRVYHRRCVLPYSAAGDLNDDHWRCEHCYIVRPVENVIVKERVVNRNNLVDDSGAYEYRLKDGRTHICKNPNCPQVRSATSYSKVKSASALNDSYLLDSGSLSRSHVYLRERPAIEEKVVVTDLEVPRYYTHHHRHHHHPTVETEYVVREEAAPTTYKTYSYVEPQVDLVPAHVERVEITEIAQGIDDRIRYVKPEPIVEKIVEKVVEVRRPEPVVEKIVEVRRPEPVVEVRRPAEVYTYAVVDNSNVYDDQQYFYYATEEDRRVETVHNCKHECNIHRPLYYTYEKSPKVTHKSAVSYDIPLTVQVPQQTTKKTITTKQIQVNQSETDLSKIRLMERQINDQATKLRAQEDRIGELTTYLRRLDTEPVNGSIAKRPIEKRSSSAFSVLVNDGKRFLTGDRSKSTLARPPAPPSTIEIPSKTYNDIQNGYDTLTSQKGRDYSRSDANLRFDDNQLGDGKNTISSRVSDRYYTDSYRTNNGGSLGRSSSALATVYDGNRGKDGIYEYVRPVAPNSIAKASYRGFLERIRFDKILFITEKLYCVIDGGLMHVYKKPTDKRQSKSYKLTGIKVKTPEDFQREQQLTLGTKRVQNHLKHPRSFEVVWKNGKSYQFVVPKEGDFNLWVNALRVASAIDQQLSFDPRGL